MQTTTDQQGVSFGGDGLDWNTAAEQSVTKLLGMVPEVGPILSALVHILWPPTKQDIWADIEAKVEKLIRKELGQLVRTLVDASLKGLSNNLSSYLIALKDGAGAPSYISEKWNVANGHFLQQLPTFQLKGYELLLLPLFAQFANMHLSLLRDAVIGGGKWGWTPEILARAKSDLSNTITAYTEYAQSTYSTGLSSVQSSRVRQLIA